MIDSALTGLSETYARIFFATILVVALIEWVAPRRTPGETLARRWVSNIVIYVLDSIAVRVVFPLGTVAWAAFCAERGYGLLNALGWPAFPAFLLTLVVFDFVNYGQHYLLHRFPVLWRIHRTHHSDADYDFTTGLRFHPLESLFVTALQLAAIVVFGPPPAAVFAAQAIFLVTSFVDHANVRIPRSVDRVLRLLFVTPDMHRIHHSQVAREGRSNLSNTFSWWDRLFGTYVEEPAAGQEGIVFGLRDFSDRTHHTVHGMLALPFRSEPGVTAAADAAAVVTAPTSSRR